MFCLYRFPDNIVLLIKQSCDLEKLLDTICRCTCADDASAWASSRNKKSRVPKRNLPNVGMGGWMEALADRVNKQGKHISQHCYISHTIPIHKYSSDTLRRWHNININIHCYFPRSAFRAFRVLSTTHVCIDILHVCIDILHADISHANIIIACLRTCVHRHTACRRIACLH